MKHEPALEIEAMQCAQKVLQQCIAVGYPSFRGEDKWNYDKMKEFIREIKAEFLENKS